MSDRPNKDDVLPPISVTPQRASELTGIPERTIRDAMGHSLPCVKVNERVKVIRIATLNEWMKALEGETSKLPGFTTASPAKRLSSTDRFDLMGRSSFRKKSAP